MLWAHWRMSFLHRLTCRKWLQSYGRLRRNDVIHLMGWYNSLLSYDPYKELYIKARSEPSMKPIIQPVRINSSLLYASLPKNAVLLSRSSLL